MSNLYVRSTDGDDADNGTTWALAKSTVTGAFNIDFAGDFVYVSQAHAETQASAMTIPMEGTNATPNRLICANDAAEPPTAVADTATVTTTGTSAITITGSGYTRGITFNCATGSSTALFNQHPGAGGRQVFEKCKFKLVGTSSNNRIAVCAGPSTSQAPSTVEWNDCDVSFANVGQYIQVNVGRFHWKGGSILAGSSAITGLITGSGNSGRPGEFLVEGVDLSNMATSANLTPVAQTNGFTGVFRNCKLPSGWSGGIGSITNPSARIEMYNCDAGDTNYRMLIGSWMGTLQSETTIVKTGGASDGTTGLSWKMTASADAEYPAMPLASQEIAKRNTTVGSAITLTVDIVHDSQGSGAGGAFNNNEVWMEVQYQGTSGSTKSSFISCAPADILATPALQPSSSVTWTTTGLTTPVKQKLQVTFTPQEAGWMLAKVCLAKPSAVVYVDPVLQVS